MEEIIIESGELLRLVKNNGNDLEIISYFKFGTDLYHRTDGPARIIVSKVGSKILEWRQDGEIHRKDGPAYLFYGFDGFCSESYYLNNVKLKNREQFLKKLEAEIVNISGQPHLTDGRPIRFK